LIRPDSARREPSWADVRSLRKAGAFEPIGFAARHQAAAIRPGMSLAEATALAGWAARRQAMPQRGPKDRAAGDDRPSHRAVAQPVAFEVYDPLADRHALEQLAEACHRYSPLTS
jgi:hypothetical protein